MIKALALFFFAWPVLVLAQDQAAAARAAAGCGADGVDFGVKTDKSKHPLAQPEAGKALVYVLEYERRNTTFNIGNGGITTRVGLDGHWVGANHGASYFFFSVDPGEHRLCTNWQSSFKTFSKLGSATSFLAEAGKVYFFRVEVELRPEHLPAVRIDPVDNADGQFQISSSAFSTSHPKEIARE